jgi:hypothetical protein
MNSFKMLLAGIVLFSSSAIAQTTAAPSKPLTDQDIALLREDIQTAKIDVITHTMQFNEKEAGAFWPVYQTYAEAQHQIADAKLALIKDYAQNYNTMDDAKATAMAQRLFKIDSDSLALREKYFPKFVAVIGAKQAAKFNQVDTRLSLLLNLQLAAAIPLIP